MITICFTYFRSLTLAHLAAALRTIAWQDLSQVESIVILDNNTEDHPWEVQRTIERAHIPGLVRYFSMKHGDPARTHSWSTNAAVAEARSPWVLFTRADFLLDAKLLAVFVAITEGKPSDWAGFISPFGKHLAVDIGEVDQTDWRKLGAGALGRLPGTIIDYSAIDSGVWMMPTAWFHAVGGLDETLTAWGHAQTQFQHRLFKAGVEFVTVPEVLYYHPLHAAERDIELAHRQLREHGEDIRELWARHEGSKPY